MTTDPTFRYAGGTLICLAKWPVCLLAEITAQDPRLDQLAELLDGETPIEEIVDFLSRDRVTRTPSFGVMLVGDEIRVVVHGMVRAVVDDHVVEAPLFFGEATVPRTQKVTLQGGTGQARLPIAVGVALASVVEWAGSETAEPVQESAQESFAIIAEPRQTVPDSVPVPYAAGPEPTDADRRGEQVVEPSAFDHLFGLDAVPQDEDIGRTQIAQATASLAELVEDFKQTAGLKDLMGSGQASGFIDAFDWGPPVPPPSAPTASAPQVILPQAGSPAPSIEPAPVILPPMPPVPGQAAGDPASGRMTGEPGRMTGESGVILPYPKPSWISGELRTPVPPMPPVPPAPPVPQSPPVPPASPAPQESFDATVRKSSLTDMSGSGDVMVVAFRCDNGHFSPPYATHCRVCGIALDQSQQPLEVARPPLGVLKLWAGGTVLLDRGVIFGRNPHTVPGAPGPQPNLLKIEDPNRDVSSQHCWVQLEDWYVTVTDLNSTNGTQVVLPNRAPMALRANDPVAIEPGTRVILANAFDFVYEVA